MRFIGGSSVASSYGGQGGRRSRTDLPGGHAGLQVHIHTGAVLSTGPQIAAHVDRAVSEARARGWRPSGSGLATAR